MTLPTSLSLTDFMGVAGLLVVAGAAMWAVKKSLRLLGV